MKRGRKSAEDLAALVAAESRLTYLSPSPHLSAAAKKVWTDTTAMRPPDHFTREHIPLMEAFCSHSTNARTIQADIDSFSKKERETDRGLKRFRLLLSLLRRETYMVNKFAGVMRLTQRSVHGPDRIARSRRNAVLAAASKPINGKQSASSTAPVDSLWQ